MVSIPFFCKLVWDVLFNVCDDALFESGLKIIHSACHSHVLDTVMDRNHVAVKTAPVSFVEVRYFSPDLVNTRNVHI